MRRNSLKLIITLILISFYFHYVNAQESIKLLRSSDEINCISVNRNGRFVAIGSDNNIIIYDLLDSSINEIETDGVVSDICFHPKENRLLVCSNRTIKIFDINGNILLDNLLEFFDRDISVVFNITGDRIFVSNRDEIYSINSVTGNTINHLSGFDFDIQNLKFSPNGNYLIAIGSRISGYDKIVRLNPQTGEFLDSISYNYSENQIKNISSLSANNEKVFFSGGFRSRNGRYNYKIISIDIDNEKSDILFEFDYRINKIAYNFSDNYIIACTESKLLLLDLNTGRIVQKIILDHSTKDAIFSVDGESIFYSDYVRLKQWDWKRDILSRITLMDEGISSYFDQGSFSHKYSINDLEFSNNARYIISCGVDEVVKLWDFQNKQYIRTLEKNFGNWVKVGKFTKDDNNVIIAGFGDSKSSKIKVINVNTGKVVRERNVNSWINTIDISNNGQYLATAGLDSAVTIWEIENDYSLTILQSYKNSSKILSVAFCPNSEKIVSGCDNGDMFIFDISSRKIINRIENAHNGGIYSVVFNHSGELIASGGEDTYIKIWTSENRTPERSLITYDYVTSLKFSDDDSFLFSSGYDGKVRIWNVEQIREIKTFSDRENKPIFSIGISHDSSSKKDYLAFAGRSGSIILQDVSDLFEEEGDDVQPEIIDNESPEIIIAYNEMEFDTLDTSISKKKGVASLGKKDKPVRLKVYEKQFNIVGYVIDNMNVKSININKEDIDFERIENANSNRIKVRFEKEVSLKINDNEIKIIAEDGSKLKDEVTLNVYYEKKIEPTITARNRALVIGIENYDDMNFTGLEFTNLDYTNDDAEKFAEFLKTDFSKESLSETIGDTSIHIDLLLNKEATTERVRTIMNEMANCEGRIYFFFSGHGYREEVNGVNKSYLITYGNGDHRETTFNMEEFSNFLAGFKAQEILIFVDACHSAGSAQIELGKIKNVSEKNILVLCSSKSTQESIEDPGLKHGVFTYYLLEGLKEFEADLNGDNNKKVSVFEIIKYLERKVKEQTDNKQHPWIHLSGSSEIVLSVRNE